MLSVLEVDIATIVASLPVFWPYLRRNIGRIMVTHEIEVKVTENFTQIDDQTDELGRQPTRYSDPGRRSEHNACTPWEEPTKRSHGGSGSGGGGVDLKLGETVMLRDLGLRKDTDMGEVDGSGGRGGPFDGGPRNPMTRSASRALIISRESKENLLRSGAMV